MPEQRNDQAAAEIRKSAGETTGALRGTGGGCPADTAPTSSAATTEGGLMLHKLIPTRWWTRKCKGNCGDTSGPHDAHLTWFGRRALRVRD